MRSNAETPVLSCSPNSPAAFAFYRREAKKGSREKRQWQHQQWRLRYFQPRKVIPAATVTAEEPSEGKRGIDLEPVGEPHIIAVNRDRDRDGDGFGLGYAP